MSQRKRSVSLSNTVYTWLENLVSTGEYSDIDDAATDLLMQLKRGTHSKGAERGSKGISTREYSKVLESTHEYSNGGEVAKPIESVDNPPSLESTIAHQGESPADELARLQALPKFEKFKNMNRITELKELLEAQSA